MSTQTDSDVRSRLAQAEANLERVRDEIWLTPLPMTVVQREQLDAAKVDLHRARAEFEANLKQTEGLLFA